MAVFSGTGVLGTVFVSVTNQRLIVAPLREWNGGVEVISIPRRDVLEVTAPVNGVMPPEDGIDLLVKRHGDDGKEHSFVFHIGQEFAPLQVAIANARDEDADPNPLMLRSAGRISGFLSTEVGPPDWGPGIAEANAPGVVFTTDGGVRYLLKGWANSFSGVAGSGVGLVCACRGRHRSRLRVTTRQYPAGGVWRVVT